MTAPEIRVRILELRQAEDAARLMLPKAAEGDTTPAVFLSGGGLVLRHGFTTDEGARQLRDQLLEWFPLVPDAPPPSQRVIWKCPACMGLGYIWTQGADGLTCSRCHSTGEAA